MCRCFTCPYHFKEENEEFACCHFVGPDGEAPCEWEKDLFEDVSEEEEEEEE